MASFQVDTVVHADPGRCFDLARDLDLHVRSMAGSGERAIAGRTSGLIELGEEVTWRARHFGLTHDHCSRITAYDRPRHFRDSMVSGRFQSFVHDHYFDAVGPGVTRMRDAIEFASPLGPIGRLVDRLFMTKYLTRLIEWRSAVIRQAAEATDVASANRSKVEDP